MTSTNSSSCVPPANPTQVEVAEEFVARNIDTMRYAYDTRTWYHFTAQEGWRANPSSSAVQTRIVQLLRDLRIDPTLTQQQQRKRERVMKSMERVGTINSIAETVR